MGSLPGGSHRGFVVEVPVGASLLANAASGARIRLQAERRPAIFPQPLRNQLCAVSPPPLRRRLQQTPARRQHPEKAGQPAHVPQQGLRQPATVSKTSPLN